MANDWFEDAFCGVNYIPRDKINFCHIYLVCRRVVLHNVGLKILYRKRTM